MNKICQKVTSTMQMTKGSGHDKTPRLITKLIDQTKLDAKAIVDLGKQLQAALGDAVKARREATDARGQLATSEQSVTELSKQVQDLHNSLAAVVTELLDTGTKLEQARDEIKIIRAVQDAEAVVARENADILDKLQPQIEGIELARQDLSKILDSVRDRMKRKELELEQSILNRQVLAGARPDLNRR